MRIRTSELLTFCTLASVSHVFAARLKVARQSRNKDLMLNSDGGTTIEAINFRFNESLGVHSSHGEKAFSFGIRTEIRHLDERCVKDDDYDECSLSGLVCARPDREVCTSADEDCICLAAPGTRAQCSTSQDCLSGSVCKGCQCVIGAGDGEVCKGYNPWKRWGTVWTTQSLYAVVDQERFPDLPAQFTDKELLDQLFADADFLYAGRLTRDQVTVALQAMGLMYSENSAYFPLISKSLLLCSLPTTYKIVQEARFLADSKRLSEVHEAGHRIQDTSVRLLRIAREAARIRTEPERSKTLYEMYKLARLHSGKTSRANGGRAPFGEDWTETPSTALNSQMMLWTELSFSVVLINSMKALGKELDRNLQDLWTVAWSVLGNMMGVPEEFDSYSSAAAVYRAMENGPDFYRNLPEEHVEREATTSLVKVLGNLTKLITGKETNADMMEEVCLSGI